MQNITPASAKVRLKPREKDNAFSVPVLCSNHALVEGSRFGVGIPPITKFEEAVLFRLSTEEGVDLQCSVPCNEGRLEDSIVACLRSSSGSGSMNWCLDTLKRTEVSLEFGIGETPDNLVAVADM